MSRIKAKKTNNNQSSWVLHLWLLKMSNIWSNQAWLFYQMISNTVLAIWNAEYLIIQTKPSDLNFQTPDFQSLDNDKLTQTSEDF